MKNNKLPEISISLSKEHEKYLPEVKAALEGFDVHNIGGLMRFSAQEMAMQVMIFLTTSFIGSAAWDLLKIGVKKVLKKFPKSYVTIRDNNSIMYTVRSDMSINVIVVPDRAKEFENIKSFDDLAVYLQSREKSVQKNIPYGWQEREVGDIFKFVRTYAISRENLINGTTNDSGIGNIHYGDIHATYRSSSINLKNVSVPLVKDADFAPNTDDFLKNGDLVMADVSEDYEGIGTTISVHGLGNKKIVGGLHTFVLRDTNKKTSERYRQYIFRNPEVRNKLKKIANGVSVYGVSKTNLVKLILSIPTIEEQNRIASVLETWDQMIKKLAKKIKVKKNIKRGLMQNLLTGAIRLLGFTDKWQIVELGNICDISRGGSPRPIQDYLTQEKDGLNWLRIGDIEIGSRHIYKTKEKIKKEGLSKTTLVNDGDFILSNSMSFGRPYIMKTTACIHDGWLTFKNIIPDFNKNYLYYLLLSNKIQNIFKSISAGSGVQNLKKETVANIIIQAPGKKEQLAIAGILTAADNEIDTLEKKLAIFKNQKKYLLNNLITGTIRTKA